MAANLESELVSLIEQGIIFDRSEKPIRPTVTIVGTQRATEEQLTLVEDFLLELVKRYPSARLVVGDTSTIEKQAVTSATMIGMPYEIVEKGRKGNWDEGSVIRDERVVSMASHVVVLDESARSKQYQQFANRGHKHFSKIGQATRPNLGATVSDVIVGQMDIYDVLDLIEDEEEEDTNG